MGSEQQTRALSLRSIRLNTAVSPITDRSGNPPCLVAQSEDENDTLDGSERYLALSSERDGMTS